MSRLQFLLLGVGFFITALLTVASIAPISHSRPEVVLSTIPPPVTASKYSLPERTLFQVQLVPSFEGGTRTVVGTAITISGQGHPILQTKIMYEAELGGLPLTMNVSDLVLRATPLLSWAVVGSKEDLVLEIDQ